MNSLIEHKYVKVMCDYCADGIWDKNGASCAIEELPVTTDLHDRIMKWQKMHDRTDCFNENAPENIPWNTTGMQEGLKIATEIKRQLPDWTVILFNELYTNFNDRHIII
jgi:hypothetical protein